MAKTSQCEVLPNSDAGGDVMRLLHNGATFDVQDDSLKLRMDQDNSLIRYNPHMMLAAKCTIADDWTAMNEWLSKSTTDQREEKTFFVAGVQRRTGSCVVPGIQMPDRDDEVMLDVDQVTKLRLWIHSWKNDGTIEFSWETI